ncbi:Calcineurin-mediated signaling pathway inhibitor DSCR1 [Ceraceosorus bombacis]|uniref:Calcineurin-mediated signaling pathway inhibitor DSCR1 n=1 Tax=Ceraceosorus bombacis TaxID=401625 RepID=A0A0P1BFI3_9BASI|nr:Calcineurin-mediated signaling pathway inhibitor DSCR1 [Ceraceosorus bombacis]
MPFKPISSSPFTITPAEHETHQQSTPSSFGEMHVRPPVLRTYLEDVRCRIKPAPTDLHATAGDTYEQVGTLWVTDESLSFLTASSIGWTLDYPTLSLHAVSRTLPDGFQSDESEEAGCVYCQTDDGLDEQDDAEGEEEEGLREMWLLTPDQNQLEPLFASLSRAASLHPSVLDGGESSHPFASLGAFGTGLANGGDPSDFDDAEEEEEEDGGVELNDGGRRTLERLNALLEGDQADPETTRVTRNRASTSKAVLPTNSLNLTGLPEVFFQEPSLVGGLLDLLHACGSLASWHPLPSFERAIVVFEECAGAARAKEVVDGLVLQYEQDGKEADANVDAERLFARRTKGVPAIRAYFGPQTPLSYEEASKHLGVPMTDRNFLISPPGSPPVGWEPIVEDPPNRDTLADDLIRALGALRDSGANVAQCGTSEMAEGQGDAESVLTTTVLEPSKAPAPPRHPLAPHNAAMQGDEHGIISVPGVVVEEHHERQGHNRKYER